MTKPPVRVGDIVKVRSRWGASSRSSRLTCAIPECRRFMGPDLRCSCGAVYRKFEITPRHTYVEVISCGQG